MDSETEVHDFAEETFELVGSKLINVTFSNYQRTAKNVAELLIDKFGCNDKVIIVSAMTEDLKNVECVDHPPCRDLNNWILYNELNVRFGKITAEACFTVMTISQSEHNADNCDCISHKKYCSIETHDSNCNDSNCILERMMRKVSGMNLAAKVALLAWFLLMATKLTDKITRPVHCSGNVVGTCEGTVKYYIGKVMIITRTEKKQENSELINNIAEKINNIAILYRQQKRRIVSSIHLPPTPTATVSK